MKRSVKKKIGIQMEEDFLEEFSRWADVHDLSKSEAIKTGVWALMRMDEATRSRCTEASNKDTSRVEENDIIVMVNRNAYDQLKILEITTLKSR